MKRREENKRIRENLLTTSKAPVTTSVAPVTTSFLLLLVRHLLLSRKPIGYYMILFLVTNIVTSDALVPSSFLFQEERI